MCLSGGDLGRSQHFTVVTGGDDQALHVATLCLALSQSPAGDNSGETTQSEMDGIAALGHLELTASRTVPGAHSAAVKVSCMTASRTLSDLVAGLLGVPHGAMWILAAGGVGLKCGAHPVSWPGSEATQLAALQQHLWGHQQAETGRFCSAASAGASSHGCEPRAFSEAGGSGPGHPSAARHRKLSNAQVMHLMNSSFHGPCNEGHTPCKVHATSVSLQHSAGHGSLVFIHREESKQAIMI